MNFSKICPRCFKESVPDRYCSLCGFEMNKGEQASVLPRFTILNGRYIVGAVLGVGGFGITYAALDLQTQTRRAIKESFPGAIVNRDTNCQTVIPSRGYANEYNHVIENFMQEAISLSQFHEVKMVVTVTDFFQENGTAYMVMEFVDGETLLSQIKKGQIPYDEFCRVFKGVCETLQIMHKQNVLHRDLGPDNIIITKENEIKIIDFGASRSISSQKSTNLSVFIKPGFTPYEQYSKSGKQGSWTDIYAFASTMYYYLTGVKVPDIMARINRSESLKPVHELRADVPPALSKIFAKALEIEYKNRYLTIEELMADVTRYKVFKSNTDTSVSARGEKDFINSVLEKLKKFFF